MPKLPAYADSRAIPNLEHIADGWLAIDRHDLPEPARRLHYELSCRVATIACLDPARQPSDLQGAFLLEELERVEAEGDAFVQEHVARMAKRDHHLVEYGWWGGPPEKCGNTSGLIVAGARRLLDIHRSIGWEQVRAAMPASMMDDPEANLWDPVSVWWYLLCEEVKAWPGMPFIEKLGRRMTLEVGEYSRLVLATADAQVQPSHVIAAPPAADGTSGPQPPWLDPLMPLEDDVQEKVEQILNALWKHCSGGRRATVRDIVADVWPMERYCQVRHRSRFDRYASKVRQLTGYASWGLDIDRDGETVTIS